MTERTMRAKVSCTRIEKYPTEGDVTQETLTFMPVARSDSYPEDGSDEDNSYARWSPSGEFRLCVANPALFGKFKYGDKFYVDFTPAE